MTIERTAYMAVVVITQLAIAQLAAGGALQTCDSIPTGALQQAVVDAIVACPNMAQCVAAACGNASLAMQQTSCADYDSACLVQAAACFAAQLTNGTSQADLAGPFCRSWIFNATNVLSSGRGTRRAACQQVSCGLLGQYAYTTNTQCTANTSRSGLANESWGLACGTEPARYSPSVSMYLALPICMHFLALVIAIAIFAFFIEDDPEDLVVAAVVFIILVAVFFIGMGIAGLVHRPLYGGTVPCNALSASTAMQSNVLSGAANLQSFFSDCDSSHVEFLGYKDARSAEKCCVPKAPPNKNFTCDMVAIVPNLANDPLVVSDNVQRGIYARCCPTLAGNTVPVGFAAMSISAAFGVLSNVLLNIFSLRALPKVKKCGNKVWQKLKKCCCCCTEYETNVETAQEDEGEDAAQSETTGQEFMAMCLVPSSFSFIKLFVSLVINLIAAGQNVRATPGTAWTGYTVYVSTMVNGSFLANLTDLICTIVVFELASLEDETKAEDQEKFDKFKDLWENGAPILGVLTLAVLLPVIITHWVTGFLAFLPILAVFAAMLCILAPIILLPISEYRGEGEGIWGIVLMLLYSLALFGLCLLVNMSLLQAVRFPVNWAMMLYGDTSFPYFAARPNAGTTTQLADFYGALFHAPFYFLQMSSQSCSLLKSAEDVFNQMNMVMMYI